MTFDPSQLHWIRPQWLWALLAVPALAWWWRSRRRDRSVWRDKVDAHLLPHLLDVRIGARGAGMLWLVSLAAALAILALAGPSWRKSEQPLWQSRAPLMIALDLSSAMLANDLPPSRLLQARAKIAALLRERAGGQVGLVVYADDAFTVSPLTDDADNVALFLDSLSPEVMPVDGSRAGRGIEESVKLLHQAGFKQGDILLLGDQADAAARDAAAVAAKAGFRVSALGMGSARGAAYRLSDGSIGRTRLDAESMRALARAGDGTYSTLTAGDADLRALGVLDAQQTESAATQGEKSATWLDSGYWLLPPAMLLALFAFRRGALLVLALCMLLPWQAAQAETAAARNESLWKRPDQQAHLRMQQGEQAYRKGDFATAENVWNGVPGAEAAYNRGNALARAGRYEDAIAAYDQALRQQPGMADAVANKKAVEAALKRKPPQGKNQDQRGQKKPSPGQQGQPPNPSQPQPGQGKGEQDAEQQKQPSGDRSRADAGDPPPGQGQPQNPRDAQDQRSADAAQRARMQRALDQEGKPSDRGQKVQGDPQRPETPAEREQRIANEAWLRRIPDDPGGLLRAKFRLEYERRQKGGNN